MWWGCLLQPGDDVFKSMQLGMKYSSCIYSSYLGLLPCQIIVPTVRKVVVDHCDCKWDWEWTGAWIWACFCATIIFVRVEIKVQDLHVHRQLLLFLKWILFSVNHYLNIPYTVYWNRQHILSHLKCIATVKSQHIFCAIVENFESLYYQGYLKVFISNPNSKMNSVNDVEIHVSTFYVFTDICDLPSMNETEVSLLCSFWDMN